MVAFWLCILSAMAAGFISAVVVTGILDRRWGWCAVLTTCAALDYAISVHYAMALASAGGCGP